MVSTGEKAPDFTLPNQDLQQVSLSAFLGKPTAIVFFPLAFSPACTSAMTGFSERIDRLTASGANILAISVDSPFVLKAFQEEHGFSFPLLSDFNREVSKLYGVQHEELIGLRGVAMRSVFILDSEGIVRYKWVSEDPQREPDYDEVLTKLEDLARSPAGAR